MPIFKSYSQESHESRFPRAWRNGRPKERTRLGRSYNDFDCKLTVHPHETVPMRTGFRLQKAFGRLDTRAAFTFEPVSGNQKVIGRSEGNIFFRTGFCNPRNTLHLGNESNLHFGTGFRNPKHTSAGQKGFWRSVRHHKKLLTRRPVTLHSLRRVTFSFQLVLITRKDIGVAKNNTIAIRTAF
jgi:hypothetical protein